MGLSEILINAVFYIFALAIIGGALVVAVSKNIVRSAFSLLITLFAVAAIYGLMRADFIFAVQILVYVGGILVLITFAIMLTHKIVDVNISNESTPTLTAFVACLVLAFALLVVIFSTKSWEAAVVKPDQPLTAEIGKALMNEYLLPFEVVSILLLACLVGAVYLARKEVKQ